MGFRIIDRAPRTTNFLSQEESPILTVEVIAAELRKLTASGLSESSAGLEEKLRTMRTRLTTANTPDAVAQKVSDDIHDAKNPSSVLGTGFDLERLLDLL